MTQRHHMVIFGNPATKKTSNRIIRAGRKIRIIPSKKHDAWLDQARRQMGFLWNRQALTGPVSVAAIFYRVNRVRADLVNLMQAVADMLERTGVLANDFQIKSWDGSCVRYDKTCPRVEITITTLEDA